MGNRAKGVGKIRGHSKFLVALCVAFAVGLLFWLKRDALWDSLAASTNQGQLALAELQPRASPNDYLVCPRTLCVSRDADATAPIYDIPVDTLRREAVKQWEGEANLSLVYRSGDGLQVRYIQRSRVLRFPDLVSVQFVPLTGRSSTLAVHSRSLIGYYDFGANRERVNRWIGRLAPLPRRSDQVGR